MVQCEFCLNFDGIKCIEPKSARYGERIKNSFEEINCPYYLEKGFAGMMGMGREFFEL